MRRICGIFRRIGQHCSESIRQGGFPYRHGDHPGVGLGVRVLEAVYEEPREGRGGHVPQDVDGDGGERTR
eukprot:1181931-Prorocentrum_minimum.AAC.10